MVLIDVVEHGIGCFGSVPLERAVHVTVTTPAKVPMAQAVTPVLL
jgi:hypothetical protein